MSRKRTADETTETGTLDSVQDQQGGSAEDRSITLSRESAERSDAAQEENGKRRKRLPMPGMRPFYVLFGESKIDGTTRIVWRFQTIGRLRRDWQDVMNLALQGYDNLRMARVKP